MRRRPPRGVETVTVQYADLDLDRKPGVTALFQRIKGAAQQVCRDHDGKTLVEKRTYAACVASALSIAVARIDRPMLTDYVVQQTGKPVAGASPRVAGR